MSDFIPHLGCLDRSNAVIEHHLFGNYLSADLVTVFAAAEKAGGGVFLALASSNLKTRREAAQRWRGQVLQTGAANHARLREGANHLSPEYIGNAFSGKVGLAEFEREAQSALQLANSAKLDRKRSAIAQVRGHVRRLQFEGQEGKRNDIPDSLLILQDGTFAFFSNTTLAKAQGRNSGQAFLHVRLDRSSARFHGLPEGDAGECAGDVLLAAEQAPDPSAVPDGECGGKGGEGPAEPSSIVTPDASEAAASSSISEEPEIPFPGQ